MAIPASVLLYTNWKSANLSGTTYTTVAPEKPVGFVWTHNANNTIVSGGGAPWLTGQEVVDLDNNFACEITSTVSASTIQATQGRIMVELAPTNGTNITMVQIEAATPANGKIRINADGSGNIVVLFFWAGGNDTTLSLGAESANPYAVELIYDTNNATRASRAKARMWDLGGTPPAFTDNSADIFSAANTTDQFTVFNFSSAGNLLTGWKAGRVAVSNDIAEDLSNLIEGGASAKRMMTMGVG